MYKIYPQPKECSFGQEILNTSTGFKISLDDDLQKECKASGYNFFENLSTLFKSDGTIPFNVSLASGNKESFKIVVDAEGVVIKAASAAGLFYAMEVLKQLRDQTNGNLPYLSLFDEPALKTRGLLLDVGRDKIPTLDTLYSLLDKFASMRINHIELYMEGFSYDYEEHRYLFADETPITANDIKALNSYAKSLFIDLVPNQNVLGHMEKWLATPQYNHLAECEDGFMFENIYWRPPMTLDTRNEESYQFVTNMLDSILENFESEYVNLNLDEPFELGRGKNLEYAKKHGRTKLFMDYVKKLNSYCRAKGRTMLMWGDIVLHNPECLKDFPKDIVLLDWIYEGEAHFESHARLLQNTGLRYCLCPGTSSWGSLTGRSDNMKKNIMDAVDCSIRFGGEGIITTDWGDLGHWQYISASYPAFAITGLYSWSGIDGQLDCARWFCNRYIYKDKSEEAFDIAYDLGNYYVLEQAPLYNTTLCFAVMSSKYYFDTIEEFDLKMDRLLKLSANIAKTNGIPEQELVINFDYTNLCSYLDDISLRIDKLNLNSQEGILIKEEMENGIRMVHHGAKLYHSLKNHRDDKELLTRDLKELFILLDDILIKHYKLWMKRNRSGGFSRSSSHINHLLTFYRKTIKELNN